MLLNDFNINILSKSMWKWKFLIILKEKLPLSIIILFMLKKMAIMPA